MSEAFCIVNHMPILSIPSWPYLDFAAHGQKGCHPIYGHDLIAAFLPLLIRVKLSVGRRP